MSLVPSGGLIWRLALVAAIGLHLVVLYLPAVPARSQVPVSGADTVVHILVFAAVMGTGLLARVPAVWLVPLLCAHAGVSELIQHLLLPDRQGDWADVLANLGGVALGWYLAGVVLRRRLTAAGQAPSEAARSGQPPLPPG